MHLTQKETNELAASLEEEYRDIMRRLTSQFEPAAMMHSELLLLFALFRGLKLRGIVESGRHRGHSTEVLSYFPADWFISIELKQGTPDAEHAEQKLQDRPVHLVYGDSAKLISPMVGPDTLVMIDGPKGIEQIRLAVQCLLLGAPVVAMHDMAPWNPAGRLLARTGLPVLVSSSDEGFVDQFHHLDDECWRLKKRWYNTSPYVFRGKPVSAYGATVAVLQLDSISSQQLSQASRVLDQ